MRVTPRFLAAVILTAGLCVPASVSAQIKAGGAATKLGRGATNIFTGWVEIPKRIYETSQLSGAVSGFTWGLLRGLGYGFIRTTAGFYEFFTFPYPAPPDYAPVLQPEYVFVDEDLARKDAYQYR